MHSDNAQFSVGLNRIKFNWDILYFDFPKNENLNKKFKSKEKC